MSGRIVSQQDIMLSIPFFCLPHPFLQFTPTEWMSGLKDHKTLCQAITVQNYIPPVARKHRTWTGLCLCSSPNHLCNAHANDNVETKSLDGKHKAPHCCRVVFVSHRLGAAVLKVGVLTYFRGDLWTTTASLWVLACRIPSFCLSSNLQTKDLDFDN